MANIIIEIPDTLQEDFISAANIIQDRYFSRQVVAKTPEEKQKALEAFTQISDIIEKLETS